MNHGGLPVDITLVSYGSRGDVQPYVALARALRDAGHHAQLVAPPNFAPLAQDYEVKFSPAGADLQAHLGARIKALPQSGNVVRKLRALRNELLSVLDDVARDTWRAA